MNGVSDKSGSLNWVLRWNKPLIMIWQGTDVVLAIERYNNQTIHPKYIKHAKHYAVAKWLVEELDSIGVQSEVLIFIWLQPKHNHTDTAKDYIALTYLAKGKEEFYGWNIIKDAFKDLKNIQLYVVGSKGEDLESINNVTFCGWVDKKGMKKLQDKCSVYIRMTEHDGYPHLVAEALSMGLEVIWNYPHPRTYLTADSVSLKNKISFLQSKFIENKGSKNQENIDWVTNNLDRKKILDNFINKIESA